jgi:hypothetical protein
MANISKLKPLKRRDVSYYRQRQKNRVFSSLVELFANEAAHTGVTKKDLAEALSKDPSQITRWLSAPSNFELDTLSDILLALGAQMEHRIVRFADASKPNYAHPLIAPYMNVSTDLNRQFPSMGITKSQSHLFPVEIKNAPENLKIDIPVSSSGR